jgi:asparagine synthetase B (glutamine-hydrolysing)
MDLFTIVCSANPRARDRMSQNIMRGVEYLKSEVSLNPLSKFTNLERDNLSITYTSFNDVVGYHESSGIIRISYGNVASVKIDEKIGNSTFSKSELIRCLDKTGKSYSVVLYNKVDKSVTFFGDKIGQRTLFYSMKDDHLIVSSHEVGVICSGLIDTDVDPVSMATVNTAGWSLGNYGLIKGVRACQPMTCGLFRKGTLQVEVMPKPEEQITPDSKTLAQECCAYLAEDLEGTGTVEIELSAGFDSRGALGATLSSKSAGQLHGFSEGEADSEDVIVAADIARRVGISFERRDTPKSDLETFRKQWAYSAVENNGNFDISVLASKKPTQPDMIPDVSICGDGGEIFRGYYYPYRPFEHVRGIPDADPFSIL